MDSDRDKESGPASHRSVGDRLRETEVSAGKHGRWFYLGWVVIWVAVMALILVMYASFV
jgi:hypothetical protein